MPLMGTKKAIKLLKELSKPETGLSRQLKILESIEKAVKVKKVITERKITKREEKYKEMEEILKEKKEDDIILEIREHTGLWMEYESELERAKPFDCFKKKFNLTNADLKKMTTAQVRDKIFRYFEIDKPKRSRTMVKYYTVHKAFEGLGWL